MGSIETCICINGGQQSIQAFKFRDRKGILMQYIGAEMSEGGIWHERKLPEGSELIGLSVGISETD